MNRKYLWALLPMMVTFAACDKNTGSEPVPSVVCIEPLITRATEVNFEEGDRIGLDVTKSDGSQYASNALLTYSGAEFSGELKWFENGGESCSLKAYYPYDAGGFPTVFEVGTDQRGGAGAYDLMVASKSDVKPQNAAVTMAFRHQFSQVTMNVKNSTDIAIEQVALKGLLNKVQLSFAEDGTVLSVPDETASKVDILMQEVAAGKRYRAIVVPQTMAFGVSIKATSGSSAVEQFTEVTMKPGYTYNIEAEVLSEGIRFSLSGEIEAWDNGGDLEPGDKPEPGDKDFEEHDGYFVYDGETYKTVTLKDGKTWMAENMRIIPDGLTPSDDLNNVTAGVYYPIVLNEDATAAVQTRDTEVIKSSGYLYQIETALGLPIGGLTTEEQARSLEGAQGICPPGWHVPTLMDIYNLVGKVATYNPIKTDAPYYDAGTGNSSMKLLNADGFNIKAYGAFTVSDNTKTTATLMGYLKTMPNIVSSGYICGSSFAQISEKDGKIVNFQFWSMLPMMNSESLNGAKQNYRIAAPVRCVKN